MAAHDFRELEDGTRGPDPLAKTHEGAEHPDAHPPGVSGSHRGHTPAPSPFCVRCACGRSYSLQEWSALELVGHQPVPAEHDEPAMLLELRNCRCGSTISVDLGPAAADDAPNARILSVIARAEQAGDELLVARLRGELQARRRIDDRAR